MLICVCGPPRAGKHSVARYLVEALGARQLRAADLAPAQPALAACWREDAVAVLVADPLRCAALPRLLARPWVLIVFVDAPLLVRFARARPPTAHPAPPPALSDFVREEQRRANVQPAAHYELCAAAAAADADAAAAADADAADADAADAADADAADADAADADAADVDADAADADAANADADAADAANADATAGAADASAAETAPAAVDLRLLERRAHIRIFNDFAGEQQLRRALATLHFTDARRLRPTWDAYFMSLARLAAQRANCMKRRVGCVIARDRRVVATGYNGTPAGVRNCFQGGCPRCNRLSPRAVALHLCLCLHAEENAIIEAGRQRCHGSTLYSTVFPCILCAKKIVQAGVARVVFDAHYATDDASEGLLRAGRVAVHPMRPDRAHVA